LELLERFARGDIGAFEALFREFQGSMYGWIVRIVRDRDVAEELTVEAFWHVYRAHARFDPDGNFAGWARRIATNLALNSVRDTRYRKLEVSIDAPVTIDAKGEDEKRLDVPEKHPNIEQHLVEETRKKMIRHAIEKLPEKQRAAVLLHKYQELDYGEISKILQCSESALKSLLFRAYETLRVELAPLVAQQGK